MPPEEPPRRPSDIGRGGDEIGDRVRFEHTLSAARDAVDSPRIGPVPISMRTPCSGGD